MIVGANIALPQQRTDQATQLRALVASHAPINADPPVPAVRRTRIVSIASGKGGVGKTNLCVNLAIALTRSGLRTVLIDGDLGLGNADVVCGLTPRLHLGHCLDGSASLQDIIINAPGGFRLVPGASGIARMADLEQHRREAMLSSFSAVESSADIVLIDCGAGIGAGVLGFIAASDVGLIVTTPEPTAITDAYALVKCIRFRSADSSSLHSTDYPQLALVVNEARDAAEGVQVHQRINAVCQRFLAYSMPYAGGVRLDLAVSDSVRARSPLLIRHENAPAADDVREMSGFLRSMCGMNRPISSDKDRARSDTPGLMARVLRALTPSARL